MPDILIQPDPIGALGDIEFAAGDIVTDGGLQTAVYISLFTEAQDPATGLGGWWGATVDDAPDGSLLWTLSRTVMSETLPATVKAMCEDALAWLIEDRIASSVNVTVTKVGRFQLDIAIAIVKADAGALDLKYSYNWAAQAAAG